MNITIIGAGKLGAMLAKTLTSEMILPLLISTKIRLKNLLNRLMFRASAAVQHIVMCLKKQI